MHIQWCSLCAKTFAVGIATVDDGNGLMDIPLCQGCYDSLT